MRRGTVGCLAYYSVDPTNALRGNTNTSRHGCQHIMLGSIVIITSEGGVPFSDNGFHLMCCSSRPYWRTGAYYCDLTSCGY